MTTNASRAPVDFDAFERDLQQPHGHGQAQTQPAPAFHDSAPQKADPLAELARIVGQDDPFRALLQVRDARSGPGAQSRGGRVEPTFFDAPAGAQAAPPRQAASYRHDAYEQGATQGYAGTHGYEAPQTPAHQTPADAFDQYLASVEQGAYPTEPGHDPDALAQDPADHRTLTERPRHRNRLISVGAGLAVVAVSITGALTWRGLHSGGGGGTVPTILADKAPLKIAPQKSDGVEIPDQNKQIYDRTAKDGQIRIVNREEQPIDVAQAARSAQREGGATPPGAVTPGGSSTTQSAPSGTLAESLGEPRRVRTVSVKPEVSPLAPQREAAEAATATPPSVIPTMTMPGATTEASAAASVRPRPGRAAPPIPVPTVAASVPEPTVPPPAPAPRVKAPQRVASVAPESTSALGARAAATASSPTGGFSVQLGVRTSESEAQAAFKQMQGKYSQLGGQPMLIRQAEVNGKTIYRVRVGPVGKAEATSLCSELQGAGGQCFVAKN